MEIHRLTQMKEGYPVDLFNKLYKETESLRRSLSFQIDHRRYGVTQDIIKSWFDDKFIFVFNKHFQDKEPDILKWFLINSLRTFKMRILRKAYNGEGEFYGSCVTLDGEYDLINIIPDTDKGDNESVFYNLAMEFMKKKLSDNAYLLFQIQIDPPPYIMSRVENCNSRIPNKLIAEFLNIDNDLDEADRYIKSLKKEINNAIKSAKEYFNNTTLALPTI